MMRTLIGWLMFAGTATAMTPPIGWTPIGPDRAVVDPQDPGRGEIFELRVAEGTGTTAELVAALMAHEVTVERFGTDVGGLVNLVANDRLGRARVLKADKQVIWWVVMVSPDHARSIDPDALLQAMAPPPSQVAWGAREAVAGGHDGSPWGEVKSASEAVGAWAQSSTQAAWNQDPAMVGIWIGNVRLRGVMAKLRVRFENTGLIQIQRTDDQGERVHEGRWATRAGLMQLDIADGGSNLPYMTTQRTLTLTYAGAPITLYKQ